MNGNGKLYIKEDITDWRDEAMRDEAIPESAAELMQFVEGGMSTAKAARAAIVAREIGKAPADIIRTNKMLLNAGAQLDITAMMHRKKTDVKTPSGRTYEANAFVGKGQLGADTETDEQDAKPDLGPSFVSVNDKQAIDRTLFYLHSVVPGWIWGRLLTLAANKQDVRAAANQLKATIDDMVGRIMDESTGPE